MAVNKLYAEGGVNTSQTKVDPVSGNEVPPGSLPEEVRDDIDAKLSGGEYIVPADVLRYYGVAFFEKLRTKAKEGLGSMEADGRIGGDTVEEEEDDLPFDLEELQAEDEDEPAFAAGGLTEEKAMLGAQPTFNPSQWTFGGAEGIATPATTAPTVKETKVYSDVVGNTISVDFINGVAQTQIPAGYSLKTTQAVATRTATTGNSDRDKAPTTPGTPSGVGGTTSWAKDLDLSNPQSTMDWAQGQLSGNRVAKAGLGIAGALLGGGLGAGVGSIMGTGIGVSNVRAAAQVARHDGNDSLAEQLDALVEQSTKDMKGGTKAYLNTLATGDKKAQALIESRGTQSPTTPTKKPASGIVSRPATSTSSKPGDYGNSTKRGVTSTTQGATKGGGYSSAVAQGSTAPTSSPRPQARPSTSKPTTEKKGNFGGGRATGGLVTKRKS